MIADNLLAYIAANQVDAILWAAGSALRPIQNFSNSVAARTTPVYPAIMFASDQDAQDYTEDELGIAYQLTFEVMIQNADPNNAVTEARSYEAAIKSMIRNCPPSTASANTGAITAATVLQTIESQFDEIKSNDTQTDFLQTFQMRMVYTLTAANQ